MPTMPNLVGLNLQAAEAALESAGVINLSTLGYFGSCPITANWVAPQRFAGGLTADSTLITADATFATADGGMAPQSPGVVQSQSVAVGQTIVANSPIALSVVQYPMGVSYP